jgi:trimeric autotransporter adhesin
MNQPLTAAPGPTRSMRCLGALFAGVAALALVLPGCGGSSDGSANPPIGATPPPPPPPPPPSVAISGVVADGPLQGATACYDLNDNGACDAGEPSSAATPANGSFTINVPTPDAGRHAVIVNVPATAIDQTTGAAVGSALTFKAPASGNTGAQSIFVSPLTTMVLGQMQATGANAADAAAYIQAQAGLSFSPLDDFGGNAPGPAQAAMLARLAVQTQIALAAALAPRLGQPDGTGGTVTQADIEKATANALRAALPSLAATAASPAITNATNVQAALVAAALDLVANQPALDAAAALAAVAAAKLADTPPPATPAAAATLRGFAYTDANNWTLRFMAADAVDNTPDSQGLVRFYDTHKAAVAGVVSTWGFGTLESRKGDQHWNGSLWRDCPLGLRSTQTQRDAQGRSAYDYCDGYERGTSSRTVVDIAGQTLASVITDKIRNFPGEDNGVAYANWGPANLGLLGTATFPAGSQLFYQNSLPTFNALAYDVTNPVGTFGTSAAAGGDARNNATLACLSAFNGGITAFNVGTLEQLVTVNAGTPCTVNPGTDAGGSSLNPNVWWGATSISLGTVAGGTTQPAGTANYFSTSANLRVAFSGGNTVKYFSCYVRSTTGGTRNCAEIGSGSYAIQTLGDGRAMTFNNLPAIAQRLSFERIFVERGGVVYVGYRNAANITRSTVRLNLPAANAVLGTLGIAAITP